MPAVVSILPNIIHAPNWRSAVSDDFPQDRDRNLGRIASTDVKAYRCSDALQCAIGVSTFYKAARPCKMCFQH